MECNQKENGLLKSICSCSSLSEEFFGIFDSIVVDADDAVVVVVVVVVVG